MDINNYEFRDYLLDESLYKGWLERALNHGSMERLVNRGLNLTEFTFNEFGDIEDKYGDLIVNLKTISFEDYLKEKGIINH